ncbi:MAG TPA: hypothetical protein VGH47_03990, partial [Xanthobacteraceae bacterium]
MRKQGHRFGAIRSGKPGIRRIIASKAAALAMLVGVFIGLVALGAAWADAVADFYKGRPIDLYIGYSVGGAYDLYARVIGRHLGAHISGNPTLVPKNLEGAGSLRLANYLYRVAP